MRRYGSAVGWVSDASHDAIVVGEAAALVRPESLRPEKRLKRLGCLNMGLLVFLLCVCLCCKCFTRLFAPPDSRLFSGLLDFFGDWMSGWFPDFEMGTELSVFSSILLSLALEVLLLMEPGLGEVLEVKLHSFLWSLDKQLPSSPGWFARISSFWGVVSL